MLVLGHRRSESVTGLADEVGTAVSNAWSGAAGQTTHMWYYIGGGVLIAVGVLLFFKKSSP